MHVSMRVMKGVCVCFFFFLGRGHDFLTSAETATASNQWSQFKARRRGLSRVSKFDTTANFTPAFLMASNTFSASGSQRCQALRKTAHEKLRPKYNKCFTKAKKFLFSNNLPYLFSGIVVIKLFKVLSIWAAGGRTDYILPEGPPIIYISAIECKKKYQAVDRKKNKLFPNIAHKLLGVFTDELIGSRGPLKKKNNSVIWPLFLYVFILESKIIFDRHTHPCATSVHSHVDNMTLHMAPR